MLLENQDTSDRVAQLASEACVALWSDYEVELTPATLVVRDSADEQMLFGVIGFVGDGLRATCLLGAHQRLLHTSRRSQSQPRDWISELSNQLAGRIKLRLLGCGVTVKLTTPLAISGIRLHPLPRLARAPLAFESAAGPVVLWLELETEQGFTLADEKPLGVVPGDVVF